jgi:hypothetical protein
MNNVYINIGSTKCCFFIKISMRVINLLEKQPFLYYAVEEAMECAKNNYYASGVLAFSQILNALNEKTPGHRHVVAHEILKNRPTKEMYDEIKRKLEETADKINIKEIKKHDTIKEYEQKIQSRWKELMNKLNPAG